MIDTRFLVITVIAHTGIVALIPDPFPRTPEHRDAVGLLKRSVVHCAGKFNNNTCWWIVNDPRLLILWV